MNYEAGLLAFLLFYVPMYFVWRNFQQKDKEIERKYNKAINRE